MARQQTQSSKDDGPGCQVWTVKKAVVIFCSLDHEIGDLCGRWRIFDDETSHPPSNYDLVNLTSRCRVAIVANSFARVGKIDVPESAATATLLQ
jgi:hypothetical protein